MASSVVWYGVGHRDHLGLCGCMNVVWYGVGHRDHLGLCGCMNAGAAFTQRAAFAVSNCNLQLMCQPCVAIVVNTLQRCACTAAL